MFDEKFYLEHPDKKLEHAVCHIARILDKFYDLAEKDSAEEYILIIQWIGNGSQMSTNSVTLNLTAPFGSNQAVPVELQNGQPFAFLPGNIVWAVQDSTIASFVQNPDGSATFTPLLAGSTGVAVTDNVTGAAAQGTLTVTGGSANTFSLSINWQVPVTPSSLKRP
jgi:hypothetical protein